ncbi:MAG: Hint domain-containing protein [Pseudomonadota bacterium]
MPQTNTIHNGSFDAGSAGWSGTDLETNYAESAYLGNGSNNHVAELDGQINQITVMQQDLSIAHAQTTELTFDTALRTASAQNAGIEGFRVDILDGNGVVIATRDFLPTSQTMTAQSMTVTFPAGGTYTLRFTELGPNDSLGAIVDNISMLVCFTAGTLIDTAQGPRAVETLQPGDLIWTLDAGLQPIRWIACREVSLAAQVADARLRPVVFEQGALGHGLPQRRLAVSPQHRMLINTWQVELYCGQPEVLAPALTLIKAAAIHQADPVAAVRYVHFLLDGHHIVRAEGALSESFFPTALSLGGVAQEARAELLRLFPDLISRGQAFAQTVRPVVKGQEARLMGLLAG